MRAGLCAVALGGCFAAHAPQGAPCDPQQPVCPENQACRLVSGNYVCTSGLGTDAGLDDASFDTPTGTGRWSIVQTTDSTSNMTTIAATGTGHAIIVAFETPSDNVVTAVTDNAGNTYTRIPASRAIVNNTDLGVEIWYATNSKPGATTLTATATMLYATDIWEVAGLKTANIVDATAVLQNRSATTSPLGASVTTTQPGDFVVSIVIVANLVSGLHAGSAFTNDHKTQSNGWAHLTDPDAPPGNYQAQWDQPTSGTYCASSAAFFAGP